MRSTILIAAASAVLCLVLPADLAWGHIEAQHTLGRVAAESTNILIVEVTRVNREKNLVICKKVRDLKGEHPEAEIKQNIGQRGDPKDSKAIMDWADVGRQAVFFYNETGSLTCTGKLWYQAFREGQWWAMSHTEPLMVRTYFGESEKLPLALEGLLAGKEVHIPCMADGSRESLEKRTGKVQTMKAGLNLQDYNPKRDVVVANPRRRVAALVAAGAAEWKLMPAAKIGAAKEQWRNLDFDDKSWKTVKAPVGYGEPEIANRKGTTISEKGEAMLFRRAFDIPDALLGRKDVVFQLSVASDDGAAVCVNGKTVADDSGEDHEYNYWNQTVELPASVFRPGRNVISALVPNKSGSSDLYFDVELAAEEKK